MRQCCGTPLPCLRFAGEEAKELSQRELQFFERVKQYLSNKEHYAEFLKCVTAAHPIVGGPQ